MKSAAVLSPKPTLSGTAILKQAATSIFSSGDAIIEMGYLVPGTLGLLADPGDLCGDDSMKAVCPIGDSTLAHLNVAACYVEGLFLLLNGIQHLANRDNYRRKSTITQGISSILAGTQMLALSYEYGTISYKMITLAGSTPFAAPVFTISAICELINVAINLHFAEKEATFEGWLDERLNQLEFLSKRLAELEKQQKTATADQTIAAKIAAFKAEEQSVLEKVKSRCRHYCHSAPLQKNTSAKIEPKKIILDALKKRMNFGYLHEECTRLATGEEQKKDATIAAQIETEVKTCRWNARFQTALSTLNLVAAILTMTAVFVSCPPIPIIATAIYTAFLAYYLLRNGNKLKDHLKKFSEKLKAKVTPAAAADQSALTPTQSLSSLSSNESENTKEISATALASPTENEAPLADTPSAQALVSPLSPSLFNKETEMTTTTCVRPPSDLPTPSNSEPLVP